MEVQGCAAGMADAAAKMALLGALAHIKEAGNLR